MMFDIKKDLGNAVLHYPNLNINIKDNVYTLKGTIDIKDLKTFEVLDTYDVEILYPVNYPFRKLPIVKETKKKIPRNPDRHIYSDGSFCLMAPPEEVLLCIKNKISSLFFIRSILVPYLANQTLLNAGLPAFFKGERSHGYKGHVEFWEELCKTKELNLILLCMEMAIKESLPTNKSECFCGSKKRFKRCHLETIRDLVKYPKKYLIEEYLKLKKWKSEQ